MPGKRQKSTGAFPGNRFFDSNFAPVCEGVRAEETEYFILQLFSALCKHLVVNGYKAYGDICAQNIRFEKNRFEFRDIHWNDDIFEEDELQNRKPFHLPPDDIADAMKRACVSHNDYCMLLDFYGFSQTVRRQFPVLPPRILNFCDAMETFHTRAAEPLAASKIVFGLKYIRHRIFDKE